MARKRLKVFNYQHIIEQLRGGASGRQIARLGIASRNKVADVKETVEPLGWLDPEKPLPPAKEIETLLVQPHVVPAVPSKVEPYRQEVLERVEAGRAPKQIWRKLRRERNFSGSLGSVKRFLKKLGHSKPRVSAVLHFEPGEAAQVDFGTGPVIPHPKTGKPTRTHVFVTTLCDSRHMYAEVVWDQKVATWLRCHRNALEFFGGVPGRLIIDNLKSAITRACHNDPEVQRSYGEQAKGYGFQIDPCKPGTPRHKGRVERGVSYVKSAFLPDRTFRSIGDANQQLLEWVLGEAGNRVHGTTREVPLQAFAEREKAALQPLPETRPELVTWSIAKLHSNCHVNFEKSFYSAPFRHVGETLHVRATDTMVELHLNGAVVAMHPRAEHPDTFVTNIEHYPLEKQAYLKKTPQWCLKEAMEVGPQCHQFIEELLERRVTRKLKGAQSTLRLAKRYGATRLEAVRARALSFDLVQYNGVKTILEKGLDQAPEWPDQAGQLHLRFVEAPKFGRDLGEMLNEERSA